MLSEDGAVRGRKQRTARHRRTQTRRWVKGGSPSRITVVKVCRLSMSVTYTALDPPTDPCLGWAALCDRVWGYGFLAFLNLLLESVRIGPPRAKYNRPRRERRAHTPQVWYTQSTAL